MVSLIMCHFVTLTLLYFYVLQHCPSTDPVFYKTRHFITAEVFAVLLSLYRDKHDEQIMIIHPSKEIIAGEVHQVIVR